MPASCLQECWTWLSVARALCSYECDHPNLAREWSLSHRFSSLALSLQLFFRKQNPKLSESVSVWPRRGTASARAVQAALGSRNEGLFLSKVSSKPVWPQEEAWVD